MLKHQTALSVAYATGLRASEVISLKVGDVDSQRMTLRVELVLAVNRLVIALNLSLAKP